MYKTIILQDKTVQVELTKSAQRAVADLQRLWVAEIHLILGCMVVKRVWFKDIAEVDARPVTVSGQLGTCFRTVHYTKNCRITHIDSGDEQPSDFPLVADKRRFVPDWLKIDFKTGKWTGTFGYDRRITRSSLPIRRSL